MLAIYIADKVFYGDTCKKNDHWESFYIRLSSGRNWRALCRWCNWIDLAVGPRHPVEGCSDSKSQVSAVQRLSSLVQPRRMDQRPRLLLVCMGVAYLDNISHHDGDWERKAKAFTRSTVSKFSLEFSRPHLRHDQFSLTEDSAMEVMHASLEERRDKTNDHNGSHKTNELKGINRTLTVCIGLPE